MIWLLACSKRLFAVFDRQLGKEVLNRWRPVAVEGRVDDVEGIRTYTEMMIYFNTPNAICLCQVYGNDLTLFAAVPVRAPRTYKVLSCVSDRTSKTRSDEYESFVALQTWCRGEQFDLIL